MSKNIITELLEEEADGEISTYAINKFYRLKPMLSGKQISFGLAIIARNETPVETTAPVTGPLFKIVNEWGEDEYVGITEAQAKESIDAFHEDHPSRIYTIVAL